MQSLIMVFFYFLSLLLMIICLKNFNSSCLEWNIISLGGVVISLSFRFTMQSMLFTYTVLTIFASVYHYSMYYMKGGLGLKRFMFFLLTFVIFMIMLICSSNLFTALIGWDGLGLSSMLLIMYYPSYSSLKASMYTFFLNRLGDCFFLMLIFLTLCNLSPSLNLIDMINLNGEKFSTIASLMIIISLTKSSQVPFSSWLTKAMEAPTPISSLVHSSTLVTAGIYLLFSYQSVWNQYKLISSILCLLSVVTFLLASMASLVEVDLKKIVAYSTLSQLGFIMFTFSLSLLNQGFFHMIMHAFFKALMFMGVGYLIHNSSGWQDIRFISMSSTCSPAIIKLFSTSIMCLCGVPYLSGFYSKDLIIDSVLDSKSSNIFVDLIMYISLVLSLLYSIRMSWYLLNGLKCMSVMSNDCENMMMSMMYLFVCSCITGSVMMWLFEMPYISLDTPKILLVMSLILMTIFYWYTPPSIQWSNWVYFFYSNMYHFVLMSMTMQLFMILFSRIYWYLDLTGLIGNTIESMQLTINSYIEATKDHYSMIWNFKEFVIFNLLVLMIIWWFIL